MISRNHQTTALHPEPNANERGAALLMAIIIMAMLAGISLTTLSVVSDEARVAGSDLQRTQTFYAASAGMEKMTNEFSALFGRTTNPTQGQLNTVAANYPAELLNDGFTFSQSLVRDEVELAKMRASQPGSVFPTVTIPHGPYTGLLAAVAPYRLTSTATQTATGAEVRLEREVNNYMVPLYQFGMFSDDDIELHPGPPFVFNGRIHTNGNLYLNGDVTLRDKVTAANEVVLDVLRNGTPKDASAANVRMIVNATPVQLTAGSVFNGPNLPGANPGARGFFPDSPGGNDNINWKNTSVAAAQAGVNNQFGGQLLTRETGAGPLMLPLQLGGNPTRELIKRAVAGEGALDPVLNQSRYHTKSEIRILIDDEVSAADAAGIYGLQGVSLSGFDPIPLDGGSALRVVNDAGGYATNLDWVQGDPTRGKPADTVRGIRNNYTIWTSNSGDLNATDSDADDPNNNSVPRGTPGGGFIPPGAGITGRILIQIIDADGTARDVTREILSMGMTEGEPNGIVYLQRPLWAAFMQGSRDRDGNNLNLEYLTHDPSSRCIADGEINSANFSMDGYVGYYNTSPTQLDDDPHAGSAPFMPQTVSDFIRNDRILPGSMNRIVPINVYNPREGWINALLDSSNIYERGMTSVVEINMRNLARWVDGVYDTTLLRGTSAVSTNIDGSNGYVVYISDRRGDRARMELDRAGNPIQMSNGLVDNEDIYGSDGILDPGEDVIDSGAKKNTLQKDTAEMPDPTGGMIWGLTGTKQARAEEVQSWSNPSLFRRAVRLFNASNLQISGAEGKLSTTKGITISTENMIYVWGSYNATGIAAAPDAGTATLNDGGYLGPQVPSSIVADAIFPLSRTWSDSMSSVNPEGGSTRRADVNVAGTGDETSVRAAILAGNNRSALLGFPDAGNDVESRLNGGMHNFPRFLENWGGRRWNYVGSICPLFNSTQALGPYSTVGATIYSPPIRNWAFDTSFRDPSRLPPGTPLFQYIEATGFRQIVK